MDKEVVIFDFDNTIVDSLKYWKKVVEVEMFKKFGVKPQKEFHRLREGLSNEEMIKVFIRMTCKKIKTSQVLDGWKERMSYYYTNKCKLIRGIDDYLFELKAQGKFLVLASSTEKDLLEIALKHFGLHWYFDAIYTDSIIGFPKQRVEFFKVMLEDMCMPADKVFFFEDNFKSLANAKKIGIDCCALIHKYNKHHKKEFERFNQ